MADRISFEHHRLPLPTWPKSHDGYRIGLLADLHIRPNRESVRMAKEACAWLVAQRPDAVVLAGDLIHGWRDGVLDALAEGIGALKALDGTVLAIAGNHDHDGAARFGQFEDCLARCGAAFLQNRSLVMDGICWLGIDSGMSGRALPFKTIREADVSGPTIVLWHEGDFVDFLPKGLDLMLAGHSHGGQFRTPWGWPPMTAEGGSRYLDGLFLETPCPLYVSRGLATTGPPSRLFCPAEVSVLTLSSAT